MTHHLETLRLRLSDELDRLTRAKTDNERKLCWVGIAGIEKEIRGRYRRPARQLRAKSGGSPEQAILDLQIIERSVAAKTLPNLKIRLALRR